MPTRCRRERRALLVRALQSVLGQDGVRAIPLLVINGPDRDPAVTRELRSDHRLRVTTLDDASLPAALLTGRGMVDTPWFAELDDDDLLLPGALSRRVQALESGPEYDAVVTNGVKRAATGDTLNIPDTSVVLGDPLRALSHQNWLLPGSYLCRTDTVGPELFEGMPRYLECTYLAIRLATDYRLQFLDCPTVVWHTNTPRSESKSREYVLGQVAAIRQLLELGLPSDVRAQLRRRVSNASHDIARLHLREKNLGEAWRWHLRSLRQAGGWRHIGLARRLVTAALTS
jgi:glycosyltransferase involved in cell wall biosynthesis